MILTRGAFFEKTAPLDPPIMWLGAAIAANAQEKIDTKSAKKSIQSHQKDEPYSIKKDPFYRIARLIMTKEEKEIYKRLPDHESRLKFIDEFWKKRDPTPGTEENESKQEFILRIAYANKWFRETPKGEGWNTERGRILLQLGFPDERKFSEGPPTYRGRLLSTRSVRSEYWIYHRYNMVLLFDDRESRDKLSLYSVPSNLSYALEREKFSLNLAKKSDSKKDFKFDADYNKSGQILVSIPVKKVSFEEKDNLMTASFGVEVYVYKNNVKIDEINTSKNFSMEKDKLLNMKAIEFSVPYAASKKGKYYFDVVIEENSSETKFREFVKLKI
jgi:GWxTD domain-containing protein